MPTIDEPFKGVTDWSHHGNTIVFWAQNAETGTDIWILPMDGDRKPVPYLRGPAEELAGRISPDGGLFPRWSDDGTQLRYGNFKRREIIAVQVEGGEDGEELEPGPPRKFGELLRDITGGARLGDDRGRLVSVVGNRRPRDIRLILDWTALLEP